MTAAGRYPGLVDMHSHSTASDGGLSPGPLVEAALAAGLEALALTDHDTVEGLPEFYLAGEEKGLTVLGGVEISLEHRGTLHLLGYDVSRSREIPAALERLKSFRLERNLKMLDVLGRQGYYLPWDQLLELSGGGQMGRPHFAALLVEKGYCQSREEAFDRLLGKGRPGYVDKVRLTPEEGLAMLREAGWAPVLAHPVSLGLKADQYPEFLARLADGGLVGLEVYHPSLSDEQSAFFLDLAGKLGLAPTAGSDFHGAGKPHINLDWVAKHSPLGLEMIEELQSRLA